MGLKIQEVGGSCRVCVLFQLIFAHGFSTHLTLSEWQAKKLGAIFQALVHEHEEVGWLAYLPVLVSAQQRRNGCHDLVMG